MHARTSCTMTASRTMRLTLPLCHAGGAEKPALASEHAWWNRMCAAPPMRMRMRRVRMGRTLSESVRVIASSPRSSMAGSDSGLPGAPAVRACMRESRVRAPCGGTDDGMDRARRQPTAPNGQGRQRMVTAAYYMASCGAQQLTMAAQCVIGCVGLVTGAGLGGNARQRPRECA